MQGLDLLTDINMHIRVKVKESPSLFRSGTPTPGLALKNVDSLHRKLNLFLIRTQGIPRAMKV
jgi:hypothetical protein